MDIVSCAGFGVEDEGDGWVVLRCTASIVFVPDRGVLEGRPSLEPCERLTERTAKRENVRDQSPCWNCCIVLDRFEGDEPADTSLPGELRSLVVRLASVQEEGRVPPWREPREVEGVIRTLEPGRGRVTDEVDEFDIRTQDHLEFVRRYVQRDRDVQRLVGPTTVDGFDFRFHGPSSVGVKSKVIGGGPRVRPVSSRPPSGVPGRRRSGIRASRRETRRSPVRT